MPSASPDVRLLVADNSLKWRRSIDEHLERLTWDEDAMCNQLYTNAHPRTGTVRTSWPTLRRLTRAAPFVFLPLERDGRLLSGTALERIRTRLASSAPSITDVCVLCSGWLEGPDEAKAWAARFFGLLQESLALVGERVAPLRIALHWPSAPLVEEAPAPALTQRHLADLLKSEIPLGPEEEAELDAILWHPRGATGHLRRRASWVQARSFWLTKRRAGQVGERFGREHWAPLWAELPPAPRPRLHLVGHSFGARLLISAVLGGARPQSLVLLQPAFSAFAFAEQVPGSRSPGLYHQILAGRLIPGHTVVVRSTRDRALAALYPLLPGASGLGRRGKRQVVAASAMGVVGARGVGAPELEILEAQRLGLPLRPVVNVEASRVITAHRDILHPEVATIVLMAAGLLIGGPDGPRPRPEGL